MNRTPIEILHSIDILSSLNEDELEALYTHMKEESYREGEVLFNEGDDGEIMYIVLSGSVAISVNTRGGESLEIAEITEGNFLGEMSIFDSSARFRYLHSQMRYYSAKPECGRFLRLHRE